MDRGDWVPVGDLRPGERLKTLSGTAAVERVESAGEEPVFTIEVEGDHCYRIGEQGILVHNASEFQPHTPGEDENVRACLNFHNVDVYFEHTKASDTTLQLAAGQSVLPGALPEDIDPRGGKILLLIDLTKKESPATYTKKNEFSKVEVLNARNEQAGGSYLWIFTDAHPVLKIGGTVTVTAGNTLGQTGDPATWRLHPSLAWIKKEESIKEIEKLGFELVAGMAMASEFLRNFPAFYYDATGTLREGTNAAAVSITFKRVK